MTTVMRVLARANGWAMVQDLNSVLWLQHGADLFSVENPLEGLRNIADMATRKSMASQIFGGR